MGSSARKAAVFTLAAIEDCEAFGRMRARRQRMRMARTIHARIVTIPNITPRARGKGPRDDRGFDAAYSNAIAMPS